MNQDNFSLHIGRQSWKKNAGDVVDWAPGLQGLLHGDFCSRELDRHEQGRNDEPGAASH